MIKQQKSLSVQQRIRRFLKWVFVDIAVIVAAFFLALSARSLSTPLEFQGSFSFIVLAAFLFVIILNFHNVYRIYWRRASGHNIVILFRSTLWAGLILSFADIIAMERPLPLSVLAIGLVLSFGGLVVVRYRSRLVGAIEWRWRAIWNQEFPIDDSERVLIVGAGESGQMTAIRLKHRFQDAKYQLVGFVDDDPNKEGLLIEGAPVFGSTSKIKEITSREKIDLIIVAIHNITGATFRQILQQCEGTSARVKVVPDMLRLFNTKLSKSFLRDVQPEDIIGRSIVSRHAEVDLCVVSNRIVMVTGAAGSIGSELARQIYESYSPKKIILLDNNESGLYDLEQELKFQRKSIPVIPVLADITNYDLLRSIFSKYNPEIVFHAAAYKHVPMLEEYPDEAIRVNIGGMINLAEIASLYKVERFVLISTDKAVNPSSVMGASKRICELLVHSMDGQKHGTLFTAVRFGNVLGSRGSVVPLFNHQIEHGGPVTVTDKEMTRYFMSISEAVNLVIHAAALTQGSDIFILKMGEVIKIDELAQRMIRLRGLRPYIDIPIVYSGLRKGEKLHEELNDDFEELVDTIHPSIMKLSDWNLEANSTEFKTKIYELVRNGIPADNQPLHVLREICGLDDKIELKQSGD